MPKKIFIGGLSVQTTAEELRSMFRGLNGLVSVGLSEPTDARTRSGYAELNTDEDASAAIRKLNGMELNGQKIVVREQ